MAGDVKLTEAERWWDSAQVQAARRLRDARDALDYAEQRLDAAQREHVAASEACDWLAEHRPFLIGHAVLKEKDQDNPGV